MQGPVGDHHTGGVGACTSGQPFELHGHLDHLVDVLISGTNPAQLRFSLEGGIDRNIERFGDQIGDLVDACQRNVQDPAHILDRRLGRHRAKGADLGNVRLSIFTSDVFDHFVATLLTEVDIDIRRLSPIRVKESFEQEVIFQRANV